MSSLKVIAKPASGPSNNPDHMEEKDKLDLVRNEYRVARQAAPDYEKHKAEMGTYRVELPTNVDYKDLSEINKLYAITQSFSSRLTAIEVEALDNHSRWKRLVNTMEGYIEDKHYRLLTQDAFSELTNMKAEAAVKTAMAREYNTLRTFKDKEAEAHSFVLMITTKKKDLTSILTTLGKQVRALALEQSTTRP